MNPYVAAWLRSQRNRRRLEGPLAAVGRALFPLAGAALLVPLVRPVFLGFLALDPRWWSEGVEAVSLRAGLLVVAVLSIDVYGALIRAPDRPVLDLHPVDPAKVVSAAVLRVAWERIWLVPLLGLLLAPVGLAGAWGAWGLAVLAAAGAFAMGLTTSAMVHLLAVDAAESPRWAGALDLVRGANPRAQAAFLYAPGVVLLLDGLLVVQSAGGVRGVLDGRGGAGWLALPFVVAALAWLPVPGLAARAWFRATAVLADIDARYAALGEREEGNRVYLEGTVRFLPVRVARYALKDLRHGWRAHRAFVTGAWLCGVAAALAGWTREPSAGGRAVALGAAGMWLCATVSLLLERDEPPFLRAWLPPDGAARAVARAFALWVWLQPCVWLPALAVALRHGVAGLAVFGALQGVALAASATAIACRARLAVYAPVAAVAAAVVAALAVG